MIPRDAVTRCRVLRAAGAEPSLGLHVIGGRTGLVEEN